MSAIHLVRHGQASFGADDYDLLSALGERQSRVLGQALAGIGPRIVHAASGEMRRQRQTADACLQAMGSDVPARVDPDWNEFDHMAVIVALHPQFADRARMRAELMAQPDPRAAVQAVFEEAMARGLVLLTCGVYGNVIRFLAPLTIPEPVFDEALDILEAAVLAARA